MSANINYEKELNPAQLEAVLSTKGSYLVIAGAGSGKTRVLVYRTAHLVEQGIAPERILLLTFTRRASREMLKRAANLLDERCHQVSGGTFHSFANFILRRYAEHVNLPRFFSILDQDDAESAINLVRNQMSRQWDKRFPKKNTLLAIISKSINKGLAIDEVVGEEYPQFAQWSGFIAHIKEEYIRYKHGLALLDYDDLLVYLKKLLTDHQHIREHLSEYYQYIMVDEYQDTNKMQAQIVQLLAVSHKNVMVVGDDSQSIYSFRGAHFKNIIDFPHIFSGTKIITLEENYRSTQPILDLTNEVINSAGEKFEKELFTRNGGKTLPVYVDVYNDNGQSRYIVKKIGELLEQGVSLSEIAILFRSGWHSNDLEFELASAGIPFVKYGGQKFIEAAHIKDVLACLQIIYNPLSEVAWQRVLMLVKGVGEKTAIQIIEEVVRQRKGLQIDGKIFQKKPELRQLFKILKDIDWTVEHPAKILKILLDFYTPLLMNHYDDYEKRLNDLGSLENIAQRYLTLEEFLTDMALEPPEKSLVEKAIMTHGENNLILSTIHSAKGLEWHTVFLICVTEGYLPSYQSMNNEAAIEEERRLFYVAATRAKNNLYLLRPQIDTSPRRSWDASGSMYTRVSRFLDEGVILSKYVTMETDRSGYKPFRSWDDE
ncbi:MAG: ATP-dependent helicase [Candidatus Omnitrophica bacterium]|nr:ATP-dependent helicase [Candidatus Omnitrophota bacterium]